MRNWLIEDALRLGARVPCAEWTFRILDRLEILGVTGDFVECGVWRGAHPIISKAYIEANNYRPRQYWLFDTFAGMPQPGPYDITSQGGRTHHKPKNWLAVSRDQVEKAFIDRDLLDDSVIFVEGMVERTLRSTVLPERISYLRLDTDFHDSTMAELQCLYPRLVQGGALVIDDYGWWLGARKAVDAYFGGAPKNMIEIDRSARLIWKPYGAR